MHCHGIVCTVFSIHQILNAICAHLGRVDLARCTRVSRCLHKTFTPPLWRTLRISHRNYTQLLATHADVFVQCVGHTRELDFWGAAPSVRVLERFLQADANRGLLVNTLTTLRIQSIVGTTGIQTLALLLQRNCARLVNLEMVSLPAMLFLTPIVDTVLTTSLRLQKQLRTLKIKGATPMSTYTLAKLLRACPPQLEVLTIDHPLSTKPMTTPLSHSGLFLQSDALDATPRDNSTSPKDSEDPTHSQFWALSHHTNIHTLELPMTIPKDQYPFMTHFLRHCCPKLESWRVSRMLANNQDHDAKDVIDGLTSVLKRHCPHLKRLQFEHIQEQTEPFYIEIIQACAPSSLEALSIEGYIGQVDGIMETLRICGHFASLREVQVSGIGASVVQTRGEAGGHEDGENSDGGGGRGRGGLTSFHLHTLLNQCPRLALLGSPPTRMSMAESWVATTSTVAASMRLMMDMRERQLIWSCQDTLTRLELSFHIDDRCYGRRRHGGRDGGGRGEYCESLRNKVISKVRDEAEDAVLTCMEWRESVKEMCRRIGELVHLEELHLGCPCGCGSDDCENERDAPNLYDSHLNSMGIAALPGVTPTMTTNTGQPTLELTLAAGLDLLQGLKRLRVLNVDRVVRHGIGKSELDWMKTCWPSLRELYGLRSGTLVSMVNGGEYPFRGFYYGFWYPTL